MPGPPHGVGSPGSSASYLPHATWMGVIKYLGEAFLLAFLSEESHRSTGHIELEGAYEDCQVQPMTQHKTDKVIDKGTGLDKGTSQTLIKEVK